jgi:glycosyltransferase involved in cell wall biosynthesis
MKSLFHILLPITRPPDCLRHSVASVLDQTVTDFTLWIVCDGAPIETVEMARAFAALDRRVVPFVRPKGKRHGDDLPPFRWPAIGSKAG